MADLVKTVMLRVVGDGGDANQMLDDLAAKAEALKALHPELTVSIDNAKALADAAVLKAEMSRVIGGDPITIPAKLDIDKSWLSKLKGWFSGGGLSNLLLGSGPITAAGGFGAGIPVVGGALDSVSGFLASFGAAGYGAMFLALMGIVNAIGDVAAGLAAAGQGAVAFGALAYPEFSTLLAAVEAGKAGLKGLNKEQAGIVTGALNIENEYRRLAASLAPQVDKILAIFTMKGGIGSQILQDLLPFAQAVAPAIEKLATQFNKFLGSPGAQQFQNLMVKLAPGVIVAIGEGIGKLAGAIGNLLEVFSHGNSAVNVINGIFGALAFVVNGLARFIGAWNEAWDSAVQSVRQFGAELFDVFVRAVNDIDSWALNIGQWLSKVGGWFQDLPGQIASALSHLGPQLFSIGLNAMTSFLNGLRSVPVVGSIISWVGSGVAAAKHALGISSPSTVFAEIGRNTAEGFRIGLTQQATGFGVNVTNTTGGAGGGQVITLRVDPGGGGTFEQALAAVIRQYVQAFGGTGPNSVQQAFGRM